MPKADGGRKFNSMFFNPAQVSHIWTFRCFKSHHKSFSGRHEPSRQLKKNIIIGTYLTLCAFLPLKLAAQDCDTMEYSLVNFIIESQGINLLSKTAPSVLIVCPYGKKDTVSYYDYFIKRVLPDESDKIKKGIDSLNFYSYLDKAPDYEWDINCIDRPDSFYRLKKLHWWIPGKLKYKIHNPPETWYTISKPLFSKDYKFAIVSIESYAGFGSGFGAVYIYKRDMNDSWEFYKYGNCMYTQ